MLQINYRQCTVCLGAIALLALSSCGKKADDTATTSSPSTSAAPQTSTSPSSTAASSSPEAASGTAASPSSTTTASSAGVKPSGTTCPASAPIKGNISKKRGKIYFTSKYPDYKSVKPETCFKDEAAAKSAGFRAPKAAK